MTQIKILVNNIHDVTHRAAAETELNVYLKTGWKVQETHQHMDADNGSLLLTTILTKEGDDTEKTESSKQETVKHSENKNSILKTDQQNTVKEVKEEKTKEGNEENKNDPESSEKEKESSKTLAAKKETKETKEGVSDEIEQFDPEEKTS
ncbi:MAG: hypothetical protein Q8L81_15515 [Bacteroidota bacterium]|nr:hypothetical protein [Bacteroidota bacterium]